MYIDEFWCGWAEWRIVSNRSIAVLCKKGKLIDVYECVFCNEYTYRKDWKDRKWPMFFKEIYKRSVGNKLKITEGFNCGVCFFKIVYTDTFDYSLAINCNGKLKLELYASSLFVLVRMFSCSEVHTIFELWNLMYFLGRIELSIISESKISMELEKCFYF